MVKFLSKNYFLLLNTGVLLLMVSVLAIVESIILSGALALIAFLFITGGYVGARNVQL